MTIEEMADIMRLSHLDNTGNRLIFIRDTLKNGILKFEDINDLEDLPMKG